MKKLFITAVLITTILMSVATNELTGKSWQLTEVRINGVNSGFTRDDLTQIGLTDGFTLNFNAETLYGIGAPNNYSAPYTILEGNQISLSSMIATLMAPLRELDKLKEFDYFAYLHNAGAWNLVNNNLELTSKTADGKAVILVFNPLYPKL